MRRFLQCLDAAAANASRRKIDHAGKGRVVVRIADQAQIGQCMLDFLAIKEAQPTINAIRDPRCKQLMLEDA